jgi:hypothetical protein
MVAAVAVVAPATRAAAKVKALTARVAALAARVARVSACPAVKALGVAITAMAAAIAGAAAVKAVARGIAAVPRVIAIDRLVVAMAKDVATVVTAVAGKAAVKALSGRIAAASHIVAGDGVARRARVSGRRERGPVGLNEIPFSTKAIERLSLDTPGLLIEAVVVERLPVVGDLRRPVAALNRADQRALDPVSGGGELSGLHRERRPDLRALPRAIALVGGVGRKYIKAIAQPVSDVLSLTPVRDLKRGLRLRVSGKLSERQNRRTGDRQGPRKIVFHRLKRSASRVPT